MSHVIQLDDDLSPSISALAHALSAEISDDNVPSNSFENIANRDVPIFFRPHSSIFFQTIGLNG